MWSPLLTIFGANWSKFLVHIYKDIKPNDKVHILINPDGNADYCIYYSKKFTYYILKEKIRD